MPYVSQLKEAFSLDGTSVKTREDAIAKYAVPTSDDDFYFRGLVLLQKLLEELQKTPGAAEPRKPTEAEASAMKEVLLLLDKFKATCGARNNAKLVELQSRYHLLAFPIDTEASLSFLKKELSLEFPVESKSAIDSSESDDVSERLAKRYPTALDSSLCEPEHVVMNCVRETSNSPNAPAMRIEPIAAPLVATLIKNGKLTRAQEHSFLNRVLNPNFRRHTTDLALERQIATLWKDSGDQSEFPADANLLGNLSLKQLVELYKLLPTTLTKAETLVNGIHNKLLPSDPVEDNVWDDSDGTLAKSLEAQWEFAKDLPDKYRVRLACNITRQQLRIDIMRSQYSAERLLNYLKYTRHHEQFRNFGNRNDDKFIETYIEGLVCSDTLISLEGLNIFQEFADFLKPFLVKAMLTRPDAEQYPVLINLLGTEQYKELTTRSELSFSDVTLHSNPRRLPSDMVEIKIRVKNIRHLTMRVFQIDMFNYWRLQPNESTEIRATEKMDLDGLCPTWEKQIEYSHVPEITRREEAFAFGPGGLAPDVFQSRGLWVIDLVGGRDQCRAITQKGRLIPLVQPTAVGHLIRVLDENKVSVSEKCQVWYANTYYKPDESGNILIPYRTNGQGDKKTRLLLLSVDGFCQPVSFTHQEEVYKLKAEFYVNPETLLPNEQTKVFATARLDINGCPAQLELLHGVSLTLGTVDAREVKSTTRLENVALAKNSPMEMNFYVPQSLRRLEFTLNAKVQSNKTHELCYTRSMLFNQSPSPIATAHLRTTLSDGYLLYVLGRVGEPCPQSVVKLKLKHAFVENHISVTLQTDNQGIIRLGTLEHITSFSTLVSGTEKCWNVHHDDHDSANLVPLSVVVAANEPFKLACPTNATCLLVQKNHNRAIISDLSHHIKRDKGYAIITGLPEGKYHFSTAQNTSSGTDILVGDSLSTINKDIGSHWSSWIMGSKEAAKGTGTLTTRPLGISRIDFEERQAVIRLSNWSPSSTFALVTATTFVPTAGSSLYARFVQDQRLPSLEKQQICRDTPSVFLSDRKLSEEYQYILNRERFEKRAGSTLSKPSMLVYPQKNAATTSNARNLDGESNFKSFNKSASNAAYMSTLQRSMCYTNSVQLEETYSEADLGFLNEKSAVLAFKPDDDGCIVVDRAALGNGNVLQIFVQSGQQTVFRQSIFPDPELPPLSTKDLRNKLRNLGVENPWFQSKSVSLLGQMQKKEATTPSSKTLKMEDEWAIVATFERIFDLFKDLSPVYISQQLNDFKFLATWPTLTEKRKLEIHEKMGCHEINLWIKRKDEPFFKHHIQPLIQSKIHKTFMDSYLIDNDLTQYSKSLSLYQGLNAAEKAFLATRVPDMKPNVEQAFNDFMLSVPKLTDDRAFDIILAGREAMKAPDTSALYAPTSPQYSASSAPPPPPSALMAASSGGLFGSVAESVPTASPGFSFGSAFMQPKNVQMRSKAAPISFARSVRTETIESDSDDDMGLDLGLEEGIEEGKLDEEEENENEKEEEELRQKAKRQRSKVPYTFTKPTTEWIEREYYDLDTQAAREAIHPSSFWIDVLQITPGTPFLSENFMYATRSITEVLFALALLDIPFEKSARWEQKLDQGSRNITIEGHTPSILVYRNMKQAKEVSSSSISIRQGFYVKDQDLVNPLSEDCEEVDPGDFCCATEYGWHLAVSNMSAKACICDITMQVPIGSIPTGTTAYCEAKTIRIEPFSTWRDVIGSFYFPTRGDGFVHLPVAVSYQDKLLAYTAMIRRDDLVSESSDNQYSSTTNWATVSGRGSTASVISYLESRRLDDIDMGLIKWRMRDINFARQVFSLLGQRRKHYEAQLWEYGVYHGLPDIIRELLEMSGTSFGLLKQVGYEFKSPLITIQSSLTRTFDILDYYPVIYARAHPLGTRVEILNQEFYTQYNKFLTVQSQKSHQGVCDLAVFAFYLVLQDRLSEAEDIYKRAVVLQQREYEEYGWKPAEIQIDYLGAYLKTRLCTDEIERGVEELDLAPVRNTARKYSQNGSLRWQKLFSGLEEFLNQVDSSSCSGNQLMKSDDQLRAIQTEPMLDFSVDGDKVVLQYANISDVEIRYYPIHVEALFSTNPFLAQGAKPTMDHSSWVKPSHVEKHTLPAQNATTATAAEGVDDFEMIGIGKAKINTHSITLAPHLRDKHVIIEVNSSESRQLSRRQTHFSHRLTVHVAETYGIVRVLSQQTKRPLPGTYVKVYAKLKKGFGVRGNATFWKDGYTGLNGVFDYVSVTEGNSLVKGNEMLKDIVENKIEQFSILVMSTQDGTVVREAYPPPTQEA